MKRAVVISHNWEDGETLHTPFEGDGCAEQAHAWVHPGSFLWRDFPESEGWVHFVHCNEEAATERATSIVNALFGEEKTR